MNKIAHINDRNVAQLASLADKILTIARLLTVDNTLLHKNLMLLRDWRPNIIVLRRTRLHWSRRLLWSSRMFWSSWLFWSSRCSSRRMASPSNETKIISNQKLVIITDHEYIMNSFIHSGYFRFSALWHASLDAGSAAFLNAWGTSFFGSASLSGSHIGASDWVWCCIEGSDSHTCGNLAVECQSSLHTSMQVDLLVSHSRTSTRRR